MSATNWFTALYNWDPKAWKNVSVEFVIKYIINNINVKWKKLVYILQNSCKLVTHIVHVNLLLMNIEYVPWNFFVEIVSLKIKIDF